MKHLLFFIPVLLTAATAFSQSDPAASTGNDTAAKVSSLTIGVSYAANASYYGQKSAEKMPYVAFAASYRTKSGFYLSGTAYRLLNDSSAFASANSAGAGVEFKPGKNLTGDISYTYTFYPKLSPFLQAANPHTISASLVHEKWLTTTVSADYAFGKENDIFSTAAISKKIVLFAVSRKGAVSFSPVVDITGGTQRFYSYYISEKRLRDSILGVFLPPVLGGGGSSSSTTVKTSTEFNILSYNMKLPVAYYRARYLLEVSCQLSLLSNKAQSNPGKLNTFFNTSFYYQF